MRSLSPKRLVFLSGLTIAATFAFILILPSIVHDVSASSESGDATTTNSAPYSLTYTSAGDLVPPMQYREWIYLTSGLDMSYNPKSSSKWTKDSIKDPTKEMSMFDNVFVNPEAYRSFVTTGTWPDKTVLVLESRTAASKGSINKSGHFQSGNTMGIELHVKDEKRFQGK